VGAEGLSYESAAKVLGVAVGTVKSRVNRARTHLAAILDPGADDLAGTRLSRSKVCGDSS
jgi:RNA polymerase sigma-70 factor (ECF subfamily)